MNDATPNEVATQFGIAAALSFSAIAAPFVPEAILAYAAYRYLRHFTYGWRTWRAPARVPLHLGRRGYRDATTRRRGDASWPIGLAATGQVWLRREDLVQGLSLHSDDRKWQAQAIGALIFGACLNRMGAIVVQSTDAELLADQIAKVAKPFGRDRGIVSRDFREAPQQPVRIATSTLASAIADLRLGPEAIALNQALMPVLEMVATCSKTPLTLYGAFVDQASLASLVAGSYRIDGGPVGAKTSAEALKRLGEIPDKQREAGREALALHARELATLTSVSLIEGFDLRAALASGSLVNIRPSSTLTTALMVARCIEALASQHPGEARGALIHLAYPDALSGASARRFHAVAMKAGAIGTLSLPVRPANHVHKVTRKLNALRIHGRESESRNGSQTGKIVSAIKECSFTLDLRLLKIPTAPAQKGS